MIELDKARQEAIKASKAKSEFLSNMSHEIRTPINAVLGMNEMIMRESSEKQIVEYAANIQSSGRTLLSIINDILDFSKIESGKMEIVPVSYDVSSLVNDILNMIRIRAEKKKLRFIYEIDENIPSMLFGDDVRIRQVITNILTNAVKYTPEGYVRLRMNVVNIKNDILRLEVSVTDTGIGIKEEDMDKLFTSFQRLDQEKNRSIEGTGLGMSIVQRLLDMMGSELKVSSVYGSGSTFSFEIEQKIVKPEPIGDFEQRFKAAATEHTSDTVVRIAPKAKVLVVDDNETNLLVAKSLLKRTKVNLDTASSGAMCIKLLKSKHYDIVFLDHMMPEMDGIETLKKIKEEKLAADTCFIALTANAIHGARQTYLDAGFDDYLSKPFTGMDIEKCLFGHISPSLCEEVQIAEENSEETSAKPAEMDKNTLFSPEVGAKYTGGDIEAYNDILALYVRKAPELSERIERLFDEKDWKNYVIEVHALKSSSLTIGSKQLSELAKELELSGKAGNYGVIEEKNGELLALYKKVAELGKEYLGETDAPKEEAPAENVQLTEITAEKAKEYFNAIKDACLAYDADEAERLCGEISGCSVNSQPLKPVLDEILAAAAEDFEYEAAAEAAEKYAENL
ncbi:MAG: ATP-binding protein [Oscillospiraceae bacterium]